MCTAALVTILVMSSAFPVFGRSLALGRPAGGFSLQNEAGDSLSGAQVETKSPLGAMIRSGAVPGWGQLYNGQYLKSGLVFLAEGLLVAGIVVEHQRSQDDRREWKDPSKSDQEREAAWLRYSRRIDKRNVYMWYLAGAHFLNIVDAYVDAHLYRFDEGPFAVDIRARPGGQCDVGLVVKYQMW
jgi:hypothetical protein